MLCLPCTMLFMVSGENCLTSNTNGKKRASPLNNEAKTSNLDKTNSEGEMWGVTKKEQNKMQKLNGGLVLCFSCFFLAFQWGCDGLITC